MTNEKTFVKPRLFVSKCLGQARCRYDGSVIENQIVDALSPYVEIVTTCPEMAIGLPTPREALRLIKAENGEKRLVMSYSGNDKTQAMLDFSNDYVNKIKALDLDGFILKHRSPSCGDRDVKCYKGIGKSPMLPEKTQGIFGDVIKGAFPLSAIENEGRLLHYNLREQFLISIYTLRAFKVVKEKGEMSDLIAFHASNKYLFMALNQQRLKEMGKLVANHEKLPIEIVFTRYGESLMQLLATPMKIGKNVNVILHVFGYFKKDLSDREKAFFLEQLEAYSEKRLPLSVLLNMLRMWVIHYESEYLMGQTLFEPFPQKLFSVTDSGKGL